MKPINITYAGKQYQSLGEPLPQTAMDDIKNTIEKIQPFEQDILTAGGKLTVNFNRGFPGPSIITECIPCDLKIRIVEAFRS